MIDLGDLLSRSLRAPIAARAVPSPRSAGRRGACRRLRALRRLGDVAEAARAGADAARRASASVSTTPSCRADARATRRSAGSNRTRSIARRMPCGCWFQSYACQRSMAVRGHARSDRHGRDARALLDAEHVDAAFELFKRFARGDCRIGIIRDQPLIAAIQRRFDHVGMLDIDAQHVRDEPADEREFLLALAQDRFHAFADAFAAGFQILQQLLPRDQARAMLLGGAELLADLRDLLAERGCDSARLASSCDCCSRDRRDDRRRASPEARRAALRAASISATTICRRSPSRACWAAMFFRSISIAPSRLFDAARACASDRESRPCSARSAG